MKSYMKYKIDCRGFKKREEEKKEMAACVTFTSITLLTNHETQTEMLTLAVIPPQQST